MYYAIAAANATAPTITHTATIQPHTFIRKKKKYPMEKTLHRAPYHQGLKLPPYGSTGKISDIPIGNKKKSSTHNTKEVANNTNTTPTALPPGLEPRITVPKTVVLPLHYGRITPHPTKQTFHQMRDHEKKTENMKQ